MSISIFLNVKIQFSHALNLNEIVCCKLACISAFSSKSAYGGITKLLVFMNMETRSCHGWTVINFLSAYTQLKLLHCTLRIHLFDHCTKSLELLFKAFIASLYITDLIYHSITFCSQSCDHQCCACTKIRGIYLSPCKACNAINDMMQVLKQMKKKN